MTEEKDKRVKMDWLDQHDSIQLDLLKMKEDIVRESPVSKPNQNSDNQQNHRTNERSFKDTADGVPKKRPDNEFINSNEIKPREKETRKIPNGSPFGMEDESEERKEAPKLPAGKIPTSPDLTMKIANVIQLENKLKRRKYELEKKEKLSKEAEEKQNDISEIKEPSLEQNSIEDAAPRDMASLVIPSPPVSPIETPLRQNYPDDQKITNQEIEVEELPPPNNSIPGSNAHHQPENIQSNVHPQLFVRRRMIIRRKGTVKDNNDGGLDKKDPNVLAQDQIVQNIDISSPSTTESRVRSGGPFKGLTKFFRRGNEEK